MAAPKPAKKAPAKKATKRAPAPRKTMRRQSPKGTNIWADAIGTTWGGAIGKIDQPAMDRPGMTVAESVITSITEGDPIPVAMGKAGVHPYVFNRWMKRGTTEMIRMWTADEETPQDTEKPYVGFLNAVQRAVATAEGRSAEVWRGSKNWQAQQAYGRQFYGWATEPQRIELSGPDGGPVQVAKIPTLAEVELLVALEEARAAELLRRNAIDAESRELLEG